MSTSITPRQPEKVIYQGDDADRLAELTRVLDAAEARASQPKGSGARLGDGGPTVAEAKAALEAFVTEAADRAFTIKVKHIGSKRFRDLVLAHPPRKVDSEPDPETGKVEKVDHPDDGAPFYVNWETFPLALLLYRDQDDPTIRTVVEPDLDEPALKRLLEVDLNDGDVTAVFGLAWSANTGGSVSPKDVASWLTTRTSSATSDSDTASD